MEKKKGKMEGKEERMKQSKKTRGCLSISPQIMVVCNKCAQDIFMLTLSESGALELCTCSGTGK